MKKKNTKKKFLISFIIFVLLEIGAYLLASSIVIGEIVFDTSLFTSAWFLGISAVAVFILISPSLSKFLSKQDKSETGVGKTKAGDKLNQYFDSKWVSDSELINDPQYRFNNYQTLGNEKKDGVVIREQEVNGKMKINLTPSIHTMIIGTTGSGKTECYINPTIRIFSQLGCKPCMVVTDPKGELFNQHSIQLREAGYRVMVLDLRSPYASTRWNPMDNAYNKAHRAYDLPNEVKTHKGDVPDAKLKKVGTNFSATWYELDGVAYDTKDVLDVDMAAKQQIWRDEAENELREIASNVVTIESKNDRSWEQGAQDFFYGLMLAMLEDSFDEKTGMNRSKFNFYNLAKIATFKDADPDNPFGTLRDYCSVGRAKLSKVPALTSTVVNNAPNTSRSYMGVLQGKIGVFQDGGICYATSENEMTFDDFVDKPTVLFIKVPDEKESRHCIATMCISQLYKKLIEKASETSSLTLPRPVHFLLDEFANLPKIDKMDSLITVGRSRKIYFHLVVQSYSQLDNKYGKEGADVIRSNCNIQIYIGTDDQKTKEDFSKLCGDISLETKTSSKSSNEKTDQGNSKTVNTQIVTRPLIYPYELGQLPAWTVIVKKFKLSPIKFTWTPFFANKTFDKRVAKDTYVPSKPLDEERLFYDMPARNALFAKKKGGFDDFDF